MFARRLRKNALFLLLPCLLLSCGISLPSSEPSKTNETLEESSSVISEAASLSSIEESLESSAENSAESDISSEERKESSIESIEPSSEDVSSIEGSSDLEESSESSESSVIESCDHAYVESIVKKATILEKGIKEYTCEACLDSYRESYYDLDEFAFLDKTFPYDGLEHAIVIEGMLPYGCHVEYEDNLLSEIGEKEATANILDEEGNLLLSKKANIRIVENVGLPVISVDTAGVEILDKENYVAMTASASNCEESFEGATGGIRFRGNGTLTYDKKAYRLKFDSKRSMLGLNHGLKAKSWVLLADYADQSMVRNATALYMGNSLFNHSGNYASSYRHVSLFLNGEYNGVYLLAEQQQANKGRIAINEADADYEGTDVGYLLELDNYASQEDYHFSVGSDFPQQLGGATLRKKEYSVKTDVYGEEQLPFIKNYLSNAYSAFYKTVKGDGLYGLDESHKAVQNPDFEDDYEALDSFIDIESLCKTYLLHEVMKSVDVGYSSFYLFVDFSEDSLYPRLTFGAPWDFDWSSGNVTKSPANTSQGEYNSRSFEFMNPWLYMLSKTSFFRPMMKKYYRIFLDSGIFDAMIAQANDIASGYKEEFARNYERWGNLGQITPAYTPSEAKNFKTHQDAVDHLTNWLNRRKASLDTIFGEK